MKLRKVLHRAQASQPRISRLLLLCAFFAVGIVGGQLVPRTTVSGELAEYVRGLAHLTAQSDTVRASLLGVAVAYLREPAVLFLLSFCAFGTVLIPLVCAWQGFTLSFAVACLANGLGQDGFWLSLAAFGIRAAILLPCTLLIAQWAMDRALLRLHRQGGGDGAALWRRRLVVCLMLLVLGIVLEAMVVPQLFSLALSRII